MTPSATHLDPTPPDPTRLGRRRFLVGVGAVAGASTVGTLVAPGAAHADLPAGASNFHALGTAVRVADTREPAKYSYTQDNSRQISVKVAGVHGVPATATAVVLTVTAINSGVLNHVTVYPFGGSVPTVSNLNLDPNTVNANMVTVKVGTGGKVSVTGNTPCQLIVDLLGYYAPVAGAVNEGRFVGLSEPSRAFDSRPLGVKPSDGSFTEIDVTDEVPVDATAVVVNITVGECAGPSHYTAMAIDAPESPSPSTSSLNVSAPGEVRAAGVIVSVRNIGNKRRIKVYAHRSAFIIVDVFGYYTGPTSASSDDGLFVAMNPQRIKDTRNPGELGRLWPHWVVEVPLPTSIRSKAAAVVCNVTGVLSRGPGHATVSPARRVIPNTSNVNWVRAGAIVPNHTITAVTNQYGLQVYNYSGGYVLVDLAGYFTGSPKVPNQSTYVNPPPPAIGPEWTLHVPRLGLVSRVLAGNPTAITDAGHSWHWTGTGYMGQDAHVSVFGHRTEAGGPYRYMHLMQNGDQIRVVTADRREYTYTQVRSDVVQGPNRNGPPVANILAATRLHPGTTFSIIACTRTDRLPTSLNHRLINTFALVSWREI